MPLWMRMNILVMVVDQWSMLDNYLLFLRTLSKIAYRRVKKGGKKGIRTDLAPKLLTHCRSSSLLAGGFSNEHVENVLETA